MYYYSSSAHKVWRDLPIVVELTCRLAIEVFIVHNEKSLANNGRCRVGNEEYRVLTALAASNSSWTNVLGLFKVNFEIINSKYNDEMYDIYFTIR